MSPNETNPELERLKAESAGKIIKQAAGEKSTGAKLNFTGEAAEVDGSKKEPVVVEAAGRVAGKRGETGSSIKKEQVIISVNEEASKLSKTKFGKSYDELVTEDKITVLADLIKEDEGGNAKLLKQKLEHLNRALQETPSPDQWVDIKKQISGIPDQLFAPVNDRDERLLAIFDKAAPAIYTHVNDFADLYGPDGLSAVDIGLSVKYTQMGGLKKSYEYPTSSITDPALKTMLEKYNEQMGLVTKDRTGALRDNASDSEIVELIQQLKKDIRDNFSTFTSKPEAQRAYDISDARIQQFARRQQEAERSRYLDLETVIVKDGADFFEKVDTFRGRISLHEQKAIKVRLETDLKPHKEEFFAELNKNIRIVIGKLEGNLNYPWRLGGLSNDEQQLNEYMSILNYLDAHEYHQMEREVGAREFEHKVTRAIRTSASPQFGDAKEFIQEFGELSDVGYFDIITREPGFNEFYKAMEGHADELIASEMKGNREEIIERIIHDVTQDKTLVAKMEAAGISPQVCMTLAERHFILTGRDGEHYAAFLHKNGLIDYVDTKDGKIGVVKPTAPMFWNFFRLLYSPEAQITFFHMGSDMKGALDINMWRNGEVLKNVKSNKGVGAEFMYEMMRNHWSLDIADFYTRRHKGGYLTNAWGFEMFDEKNKKQYDPRVLAADKDRYYTFDLPTEIGQIDNPAAPADFDELHKIWYSELEDGTKPLADVSPGKSEFRAAERMYLNALVGKDLAMKMGMTEAEVVAYKANPADHKGVVSWEAMDGLSAWDDQKKRLSTVLQSDSSLSAADKVAIEHKISELDKQYRKLNDERSAFNSKVLLNAEKVKGPTHIKGISGYEKDQFMDLSKADLSKIPHTRFQRQAEIARGNIRDHVSALNVLIKILNLASDASWANFNELTWKDTSAYTRPGEFQAHIMTPAYQAMTKVWRGKLPFGLEIPEIPATRSPMGQVFHVKSNTDAELYKQGLAQVAKGNLTMEQLIAVRGGTLRHMGDELANKIDVGLMGVVGFAVVQKQLEKLEKDAEKS